MIVTGAGNDHSGTVAGWKFKGASSVDERQELYFYLKVLIMKEIIINSSNREGKLLCRVMKLMQRSSLFFSQAGVHRYYYCLLLRSGHSGCDEGGG